LNSVILFGKNELPFMMFPKFSFCHSVILKMEIVNIQLFSFQDVDHPS
jgi:hypothetical protein